MSVHYRPVQWNPFKYAYDGVLVTAVIGYVTAYQSISRALFRGSEALSAPILAMRAWGSCAFLLLSFILCLGPLARLDARFLPLVYNRRHAGVVMALVAWVHALQVLGFYFAYGKQEKWVALFTYDERFTAATVPFVAFGIGALVIVSVMAATSHDFWQRFLGATFWKSLHMLVYLAYASAVVHVAFGALAREQHPAFTALVLSSTLFVIALHVLSAWRSTAPDRAASRAQTAEGPESGWIDAGPVDAVPEDRARPVCPPNGERIALINHGGLLYAVHGTCAHQRGPLYEGRVKDGCLTCPWHGWQYRPEDGRSPPPFEEVLPTYRLRVKNRRVWIDPKPLPPGTPSEPVPVSAEGKMSHVKA